MEHDFASVLLGRLAGWKDEKVKEMSICIAGSLYVLLLGFASMQLLDFPILRSLFSLGFNLFQFLIHCMNDTYMR